MTSNKKNDETQRNFAKVFLDVETLCRSHGIDNKTGVNPYRIIVSKKKFREYRFRFC